MTTALGYGSVREVWYASLDDPTNKHSFLIRDDAFSKTGAVFGRTVRLGEPLNTGPGSGWRQLSWEGGALQHDFKDEQMFFEGNADVWSHVGRIRMWPGWAHIHKDATRKFDSFSLASGNDGPAIGDTKLYVGERNFFYAGSAPSGGFKIYKYDPSANTMTQLNTSGAPSDLGSKGYTAIAAATDDSSSSTYIYVGTGGGLWLYQEPTDTWFHDTNAVGMVQYDSITPFRDAMYYLSGKQLVKRTPLAPYGTLGTHTVVKTHKSSYVLQGMTVWNNRLWYGLNFPGNHAMLATSDGTSAQTVITFPEEFFITQMVSHYGALYIAGARPQAVAGTNAHQACVSVVWKYTGSSLTKLWEADDEDHHALTDGHPHIANGITTFGSLLVWSNPGFKGSTTPRPGLMCYDAEKDAVFEGPGFPLDPQNAKKVVGEVHRSTAGLGVGFAPTSLFAWDNTLVAAYHDFKDYSASASGVDFPNGVAYLRFPGFQRDKHLRLAKTFKGRSVEHIDQERTQFVLSSRYRGDQSVTAEIKTWLTGKLTCKVPKYTKIRVYIVTDEFENYLVDTITYNGNDGWRQVRFAIKNPGTFKVYQFGGETYEGLDTAGNGTYLQSSIVQYRLELVNTDFGNVESQATPEVDAIEIGWTVAPQPRLQYHLRHVMQDGQDRLDGTPNPLTTAVAQADALQALWADALPFRMWGPFAAGTDPTTLTANNCIEVVPSVESFNNQQYRVEDPGSEVAQETGLTLIENVV